MAENKGYEVIARSDPRFNNIPERIKEAKGHGMRESLYYSFRDGLSIFDRYHLLQDSTLTNKYSDIITQYLVLNMYSDDIKDPVATLKAYIDNAVDYDNYLYYHKDCSQDHACLPSEKPQFPDTPDLIIVSVEDWMKNYMDDDLIEKIRIAYHKNVLHEKMFTDKMVSILMERRENVIDSIFSEEISDDLVSVAYRGNKDLKNTQNSHY